MTIWNLGGINIDHIYEVPHIPAPGETLDGSEHQVFLGGKGANMSVAAARAGAHVRHIGAVGQDGQNMTDRLMEYGVDTRGILNVEIATAHAIIFVAPDGENAIMVYPGANRDIPLNHIKQSLTQAETGDWFICQNEVNHQIETAKLARDMGLNVAYAAAPFDAAITKDILPYLDFLILNEVEAEQLKQATAPRGLHGLVSKVRLIFQHIKSSRSIPPVREIRSRGMFWLVLIGVNPWNRL